MAKIRTFICFELPESVKKEVAQLQSRLKDVGRGVRWSHPDGIHLTLKFLGDVDANQITNVHQAVQTAAKNATPFRIRVFGTGAFPNFARPRVFWIGVNDPDGEMIRLQANIETELARIGFLKEERRFSPHLTLGRVKSADGLKQISAALQEVNFPDLAFIAKEIIIMKSELQPGGARYTPLSTVKLAT